LNSYPAVVNSSGFGIITLLTFALAVVDTEVACSVAMRAHLAADSTCSAVATGWSAAGTSSLTAAVGHRVATATRTTADVVAWREIGRVAFTGPGLA
jgi:hypothetical protein